MLFIARFTDKPDMGELRESLFPAHVKWLEENKDSVLVPGSLRPDVDEASVGGLWIIEAESKAAVEALYTTDPFWVNGLRQRAEVFYWKKAFEDRKVPI
jgi:uncharacterized protein YciI